MPRLIGFTKWNGVLMGRLAWALSAVCLLSCDASEQESASQTLDAATDSEPHAADEAGRAELDVDADAAPTRDADAADEADSDRVDLASLPPAAVRGRVFIFGPPGGTLEGAAVFVFEQPDIRAVTGSDGRFELTDVPPGDVTLVMLADGYPENQLGTQRLLGEDLEQLDFQAVPQSIYDLFAFLTNSVPDPERCQVSTTVTRWFEGSLPTVHGEPGATATITPSLPPQHGPTYFNEEVLPTPGLTETSVDGGVVWTNVPPGEYVLRAHKEEVEFDEVRILCRAGVLVNAGPPQGLQGLVPGSGY